MFYTFMNKNTPIARVVSEYNGKFMRVEKILNPEYAPVSFDMSSEDIANDSMYDWWGRRKIPASRDMLRNGLANLGLPENTDTAEILTKAYGLSLTDQYWMCPEGSGLKWEDINFFTNRFSDDIGEALFDNSQKDNPSLMSPDSSLGGGLRKKWKILDDQRCLLKSGTAYSPVEPYNEVFANYVCDALGIKDYVHYKISTSENNGKTIPISICPCFISPDTELVSGIDIIYSPVGKRSGYPQLSYERYVYTANILGVEDIEDSLSDMFLLDLVINNVDRHYNNFGLIRDVNTLKFVGVAPIYDCGTSMYAKSSAHMLEHYDIESDLSTSRPIIAQSLRGQMKYISSNRLNKVCELYGLETKYRELYSKFNLLPNDQIVKVWSLFKSRIDFACREWDLCKDKNREKTKGKGREIER